MSTMTTTSTSSAPSPTEAFRAARDQLLAWRGQPEAAVAGFAFPDVGPVFNWGVDWFDAVARGNDAPALVIVGVFMFQTVAEIKLDNFAETMPAVVTLLCIPLTFSIAEGLGLGVIALAVLALFTGRARSVPAFTYALAGLFFLHIFHGLIF